MKITKSVRVILNSSQLVAVKSVLNGVNFCYRVAYGYEYGDSYLNITDKEDLGRSIKNIFYDGLRDQVNRGNIDATHIKTLKPYIEACIQGGRDKISLMRSNYIQDNPPKMLDELDRGVFTIKLSNNPNLMIMNSGSIVTADFGILEVANEQDIADLTPANRITSPCMKFYMLDNVRYNATLIFDADVNEIINNPFAPYTDITKVNDVSALTYKARGM